MWGNLVKKYWYLGYFLYLGKCLFRFLCAVFMTKLVSYIIFLFLFFSVFVYASDELTLDTYKINNSSVLYLNPWDTLRYKVDCYNDWTDNLHNVTIKIYTDNNANILFNAEQQKVRSDDGFKLDPVTSDYYWSNWLEVSWGTLSPDNGIYLYKKDLPNWFKIDPNISDYAINVKFKCTSDEVSSDEWIRSIYVNVKPHIIDYYFTDTSWNKITSVKQLQDFNLNIKVKDYNWCENIDNADVKADLSSLWLSDNEKLSYVNCEDWNGSWVALYQLSNISTSVDTWDYTITYDKFSVVDEDWNENMPDDSNTDFDDEDKKDDLVITVTEADAPTVSILSVSDDYIGWTGETTSTVSFSWSQDWQYKVVLSWCDVTDSNLIFQDWTWYTATNSVSVEITSDKLSEGSNTVFVCLKNDTWKLGSSNFSITKDTTAPTISDVSYWPANIVDEDVEIDFVCSEDWYYKIVMTSPNSKELIWRTSTSANTKNSPVISWNEFSDWENKLTIYCKDNAWNIANYNNVTITKYPPTPSMSWDVNYFADDDIDYAWLDWRDIHIKWDNSTALNFSGFESYRIYILPSSVELDTGSQNYVKLIDDSSVNEITLDENITKDSVWDDLVDDSEYVAYVMIMWKSWRLWEAWKSPVATLHSDTVQHPVVLSAKFIDINKLSLHTDAVLDTDLSSHSGSLVSFEVSWTAYTWIDVLSVSDQDIVLSIPNLSSTSSTWTNLELLTGALHSKWGWFNNYYFSGLLISDWIKPNLSLSKNTSAWYKNFYSWSINFSFDLSEDCDNWYIEFVPDGWASNSSSDLKSYLYSSLLTSWSHSEDVPLSWDGSVPVNLTCGSIYSVRLFAEDKNWNSSYSSTIDNIAYDACAPVLGEIHTLDVLWDKLVDFSWDNANDDNGYWAWVKNYEIAVYDWTGCSTYLTWKVLTSTGTSFELPYDDAHNYSWRIKTMDNMWNVSNWSDCDDFIVDGTVPTVSDFVIKDTDLNSTTYIKSGSNVEITANTENTDAKHIWFDLSLLQNDTALTGINCENPVIGYDCNFSSGAVKLNFKLSSGATDWLKTVKIIVENTNWFNEQTSSNTIKVDVSSPKIDWQPITNPTWAIGWTTTDIVWDTSKVTDSVWLAYINLFYLSWTDENLIYSWSNTSPVTWSLSWINSWNYKIKLLACDFVWQCSFVETDEFTIDKTAPTIKDSTLIYPNWWEILAWWQEVKISWNSWDITDDQLWTNPISLYYTTDWTNWDTIATWLENNWSYTWTVKTLDSDSVKIKLVAQDTLWNESFDLSDNDFVVDSTNPSVWITYSTNGGSTPPNGSSVNTWGFDITITSTDTYQDKVYYMFKDTWSWTYYNGTWFVADETWILLCEDTLTWWNWNTCNQIVETLTIPVENDKNYQIKFKSVDEAWNIGYSIPLNYVWDTQKPVLTISTLSGTYFKNEIILTWTASDNYWINAVFLSIKNENWKYWNWNKFVDSLYNINADLSWTDWSYTLSLPDDNQTYQITVTAEDKSYKVHYQTSKEISLKQDTTSPYTDDVVFTFPVWWEILKWWDSVNITWDTWSIVDTWAGIEKISLYYWNGSDYSLISDNLDNTWTYSWTVPSVDIEDSKIKMIVTDKVWNQTTIFSNSFSIDTNPPTIQEVQTMDQDTNWQIDSLLVIFSESIKDSSVKTWDFSIDWIVIKDFDTATSSNDNKIVLYFDNTGSTATTPTLKYVKWNLTDLAWNLMEDITKTAIDKASPRIKNAEFYDQNTDWKFDTIKLYFSENLSGSSSLNWFTLTNAPDGTELTDVSVDENTINLTYTGSDIDTYLSGLKISFTNDGSFLDLAWNQVGWFSDYVVKDKALPVIVNKWYYDDNSNWKPDVAKICFSENITWFDLSDWTFTWFTVTNWSVNNNCLNFDISEPSEIITHLNTASFSYSKNNMQDLAGNLVNALSWDLDDKIAPIILQRLTLDTDNNWKIDSVKFIFSEPMNNDTSSFIVDLDGYSFSWYKVVSNTWLLVSFKEWQSYDTYSTVNTKITSNSTLTDLYGNLLSVDNSYESSTDKASPYLFNSRYDEWIQKLYLTFSENITWVNIDDFYFENAWTTEISGADFSNNQVVLVLKNPEINYSNTEVYVKTWTIQDLVWNTNSVLLSSKISASVIINEVMLSWNNQYVELKNTSSADVNLSWWIIKNIWWDGVNLTLPDVTISANWYYLIGKTNSWDSLLSVQPDYVYSDMNLNPNWQNNLILENSDGVKVDEIPSNPWPAWDAAECISMERKNNSYGLDTSSWYDAQVSINFDDTTCKWTPWADNVFDGTSPSILEIFPNIDDIMPAWNFYLKFKYVDDDKWVGIDKSTANVNLYFNSWWNWVNSSCIDDTYVKKYDSYALFITNNCKPGKYKVVFSVKDKAWNLATKESIFYVDDFYVNISTNQLSFPDAITVWDYETPELKIYVNTIWRAYSIDLKKLQKLTWPWEIDFQYSFNDGNWYSSYINFDSVNLLTQSDNPNSYSTKTYWLKFKTTINATNMAGNYIWKILLNFK